MFIIVLFRRSAVKKIVKSATDKGYTDVIIINEDQKMPNGFLVIHLPDGPTAHFKLSNCRITKEMKKNYREISTHRPEVSVFNTKNLQFYINLIEILMIFLGYSQQFHYAVRSHSRQNAGCAFSL